MGNVMSFYIFPQSSSLCPFWPSQRVQADSTDPETVSSLAAVRELWNMSSQHNARSTKDVLMLYETQ